LGRRGDHPALIGRGRRRESHADRGLRPAGPRATLLAQIRWLAALVGRHEQRAYTLDRHGTVANPAVDGDLRDLMHQLAEFIFRRDGRYPRWWRAGGERPDEA
jgi:hypothetical protein